MESPPSAIWIPVSAATSGDRWNIGKGIAESDCHCPLKAHRRDRKCLLHCKAEASPSLLRYTLPSGTIPAPAPQEHVTVQILVKGFNPDGISGSAEWAGSSAWYADKSSVRPKNVRFANQNMV